MKIGAIIAEYNPFHNGHQYQLEYFRHSSRLDYVIIIMSGNFTQRGEPAWMPKHLRTEMALKGGADLVIELPTCYATGSAAVFAEGAIAHLNALGCVDELCFGCETEDQISKHLNRLHRASDSIMEESEDFKYVLTETLKKGLSYPAARAAALKICLSDSDILFEPNNILALEYMIALKKSDSRIRPFPIKRQGPGYHSDDSRHIYASASALRKVLNQPEALDSVSGLSPDSRQIISDNFGSKLPLFLDDFSAMFTNAFLYNRADLSNYSDMNDEIANRMHRYFDEYTSLSTFLLKIKNKSYTYSRLCRCAAHILTRQNADVLNQAKQENYAYYARVLGFKKEASPLLNQISQTSSIPLITKMSAYPDILKGNGLKLIETDIFASDIYRICTQMKFGQPLKNEFTEKIVII